jgi:hypothetical protein
MVEMDGRKEVIRMTKKERKINRRNGYWAEVLAPLLQFQEGGCAYVYLGRTLKLHHTQKRGKSRRIYAIEFGEPVWFRHPK